MWTKTSVYSVPAMLGLDRGNRAPAPPFIVKCLAPGCEEYREGEFDTYDEAERVQRAHIREVHPIDRRTCDACGAPLTQREHETRRQADKRTVCNWQCHCEAKRAADVPDGALF